MALPEKYNLTLPEPESGSPNTPKYKATEMARLCEKQLPLWNTKRFAEEPVKREFEPFRFK